VVGLWDGQREAVGRISVGQNGMIIWDGRMVPVRWLNSDRFLNRWLLPHEHTMSATQPLSEYTITKRIAKHGKESMILIPAMLRTEIPAGSLAKVTIQIIRKPQEVGE